MLCVKELKGKNDDSKQQTVLRWTLQNHGNRRRPNKHREKSGKKEKRVSDAASGDSLWPALLSLTRHISRIKK